MTRATIPRRRVVGSAVSLLGLVALGTQRLQAERAVPRDDRAIRPPGAVAESRFLAACVRCGLCVQACPFDTLKLGTAEAGSPVAAGTPYFHARDVPCEMCDDIPCRRACPTGALVPTLSNIDDARMGTAWLSSPDGCYSFIGAARCDSCWRACPLRDSAITMLQGRTRGGGRFTPTVDGTVCTGCGLCEKACIAVEPAITVKASRGGQPSARRRA
jgi:ferredoxin-type protein NapG